MSLISMTIETLLYLMKMQIWSDFKVKFDSSLHYILIGSASIGLTPGSLPSRMIVC